MGFEDEDGNHIDGLTETSDVLQKYMESRPKEWDIVERSLGVSRSFSKHACAFVIADRPISDLMPIKEGHITQYEAAEVEMAGAVKYDFLTISHLKDIRVCLDLINKKNGEKNKVGYFTHNGKLTYIWDLPEDPAAYKSVWNGDTESCFQINTSTMTPFVKDIMPQNMEDLSLILSLVRPGPLDYVIEETGRNMAEEYIYRRNGNPYEDIPVLRELLPKTHSVLVYQEDVTKIAKQLAGFSGSAAENLREAIGKKKRAAMLKIKPEFVNGCVASGKVTEAEAQQLWDRIVTFGRYAFNKSHGISYSYITYACMFLKHHYNLEFWAAILTNAKQNEISGKLWPHVKHLLAPPDINLSSDEMEIDYANQKIRAKFGIIRGMGDKSIDPIVAGRPYKDIRDFVNKEVAGPGLTRKLIHVGVLDSLFPPKIEFLEKLQSFEDALESKKYDQKVDKAAKEGKQIKTFEPKKGIVPEDYVELCKDPVKNAMKNAAIQKSILPSLLVGLHDLGRYHSKCIVEGTSKPSKIMTYTNYDGEVKQVLLITGEMLQRLDETPGEAMPRDAYVAVTAFIVDTDIFDYKKNTKQALKVTLDCDGVVGEKVLWPNYFSGVLEYPKELKKGQICTVFLKKRAGKNDPCSITDIVIEA
jgi:DNA polymerase III alpha subunit